eukprot:TRINITY_DN2546_c3_g1_i1.p1 TRINITY_DN2546_c3_g1~~TRINITY_DN2546_c3_g1_i1.p1  ORF type:complete len:1016 (+),score=253.23 TRINITY_DN2546_c3_g1_i1:108-3155(+)
MSKCPSGHALERHPIPDEGYGCDECQKELPQGTVVLGCKECDWDVCDDCLGRRGDVSAEEEAAGAPAEEEAAAPAAAAAEEEAAGAPAEEEAAAPAAAVPEGEPRPVQCPAGHSLQPHAITEEGYGCDVCEATLPPGAEVQGCKECDWDVCGACFEKRRAEAVPEVQYVRELPIGAGDYAAVAAAASVSVLAAAEAPTPDSMFGRVHGGSVVAGQVLHEGVSPLAAALLSQLRDESLLASVSLAVCGAALAHKCDLKRQKLHRELYWDWNDDWAPSRRKDLSDMFNPPKRAQEPNTTCAVLLTASELRRVDDQPSPAGKQYMCEWRFLLGGETATGKKEARPAARAPESAFPGGLPSQAARSTTPAPTQPAAAGTGDSPDATPEGKPLHGIPPPSRAVEGWGRTSWRAMEQGRVQWKEWFALFQVELPKPPVHPSSRKFVEFFFFERDKRKGDKQGLPPYFAHVKVQLLFDNERRKRASLMFLTSPDVAGGVDESARGRFVFDIELQLKENPMRPADGQHIFPLRRGTQGPVLDGPASYIKMEDLDIQEVTEPTESETTATETKGETTDAATATDGGGGGRRRKRKARGVLSGSKRAEESSCTETTAVERKGPRIKSCKRCRLKYAEEFNGEESCPRGKHWGRLVWEPGLVARNLAVCMGAGVATGAATGGIAAWLLHHPPPMHGLRTAGAMLAPSKTALDAAQGHVHHEEAFMDHWHGFRRYFQDCLYLWATNTTHPAVVGATWGGMAGLVVGGVLAAQRYGRCESDGTEVPSPQQVAEWAALEKEDRDNLAAGVTFDRASTKKEMDEEDSKEHPQQLRDKDILTRERFLHTLSGYRWNCCDAAPYVGFCTGKTRHRSAEDDAEDAEADFLAKKKAEEEQRAEMEYEKERQRRAAEKEAARFKGGAAGSAEAEEEKPEAGAMEEEKPETEASGAAPTAAAAAAGTAPASTAAAGVRCPKCSKAMQRLDSGFVEENQGAVATCDKCGSKSEIQRNNDDGYLHCLECEQCLCKSCQ